MADCFSICFLATSTARVSYSCCLYSRNLLVLRSLSVFSNFLPVLVGFRLRLALLSNIVEVLPHRIQLGLKVVYVR